jgi:Lon protease-like protein
MAKALRISIARDDSSANALAISGDRHHACSTMATQILPVFPLRNVCLFPGTELALHIFEPRYRAMLADALDGDGLIVIAQPRVSVRSSEEKRSSSGNSGDVVATSTESTSPIPGLVPIGCTGAITKHKMLPDGRSNITLRGGTRVSITEVPSDRAYRLVSAEPLFDLQEPVAAGDESALRQLAAKWIGLVQQRNADFRPSIDLGSELTVLSDRACQYLVLDDSAKQDLLETLSLSRRVRKLPTTIGLQLRLVESGIPSLN